MGFRLFLGPLDSFKNLKALMHSLDTANNNPASRSVGLPAALYGGVLRFTNDNELAAASAPTCPPTDPCEGCGPCPPGRVACGGECCPEGYDCIDGVCKQCLCVGAGGCIPGPREQIEQLCQTILDWIGFAWPPDCPAECTFITDGLPGAIDPDGNETFGSLGFACCTEEEWNSGNQLP